MCEPTNPFAALLEDNNQEATHSDIPKINDVIEEICGFTLNENKKTDLVYLEDLASTFPTKIVDLETLGHALFERTLLTNPEESLDFGRSSSFKEISETKVILYLFTCFKKSKTVRLNEKLLCGIRSLIIRNVVTALKQPEIYEKQNLVRQWYEIMKEIQQVNEEFFTAIYQQFLEDEDGIQSIREPFTALLKLVHRDVAKATLTDLEQSVFFILNIYCSHEVLAKVLLDYCQPNSSNVGIEYANTVLGALFSVSVLPKTANGNYEFFQNPLDQASNTSTEGLLWTNSERITGYIYDLILKLLKCTPEIKSRILSWLGGCLRANADRGKLWNSQIPDFNPRNLTTVSDGFMINFGHVLMKLCEPFCSNINDVKILKVDPTYCAVINEDCGQRGIHLQDMSSETCLIPLASEESVRPTVASYNFVTECFYMGHKALDLGYRVTIDKLVQLNQDMARIERAYNEAVSQSGGINDVVETIKQRMESELTKYLSIKSRLSDPRLLKMICDFVSASSLWLTQVALNVDFNPSLKSGTALVHKTVTFPLPVKVPDTLMCIPEFLVENIVGYLVFLRRFNPKMFEEQGYDCLHPILTFILVFMGSPQHMKNPHLRARLAEALEALLPYHKDEHSGLNTLGGHQREKLFLEHVHRKQIVRSLLEVFVGIELTGQSVQFEQKFNYRRPMYMVMDYLWEMEEYQQYFKQLAQEAELNMEAVMPPLFLRFVNLLINDAIYLLDESLSNMAKLREMQTARERGEWDRLPAQERAQNLGYMQHTGMLARSDNILGKDTIRTLENLTSCIRIVFTHSTMVDRVASMLNYFLFNLVGPNQKNFKVKDQREYSFDPAGTVLDICKIYVNLKESDTFCLAISQDGRSYSPQLFTLAEDVLIRIGGGPLVGELQEVACRVANKVAEYQANEEAAAGAPENFLDPIMNTLMVDPVILPSSKQTVDRSTIARHLLSDQTDPFNRAPLTMDQVISNTELAKEIRKWLEDRKK